MSDLVNSMRQLFQDIIAPEIKELRGNILVLDAKIAALDNKVDIKIGALDNKIDTKIGALDTKIGALDTKIDVKTDALAARMDLMAESLRSEIKSSAAFLINALENASLRSQRGQERHRRPA